MKTPFVVKAFASALLLLGAQSALLAEKATFHVIYSNDATNIPGLHSPWHDTDLKLQSGQDLVDAFDEEIRSSVDEAAVSGVDAMCIQPGLGWVRWWQDVTDPPLKQYIAEHNVWFNGTYGYGPNPPDPNAPCILYHKYFMAGPDGGDLVDTFLTACQEKGIAGFISLRLNDRQGLIDSLPPYAPAGANQQGNIVEEYEATANRKYLVGPIEEGKGVAWNWDYVVDGHVDYYPSDFKRRYVLGFIGAYQDKLAGVELDFMRYPIFFNTETDNTNRTRRIATMTRFIRSVRERLNSLQGPYRFLMVRIPSSQQVYDWELLQGTTWTKVNSYNAWDRIGFDAAAWAEAGVDIFNMTNDLVNETQDVKAVREALNTAGFPDASIYSEVSCMAIKSPWNTGTENGYAYRPGTVELLNSAARVAYASGADGISVFNFPYYRLEGETEPNMEPLFNSLATVSGSNNVQTSACAYGFYAPRRDSKTLVGNTYAWNFQCIPWSTTTPNGLLRIQVLTAHESGEKSTVLDPPGTDRGTWQVKLNGTVLNTAPLMNVAYPFRKFFGTYQGKEHLFGHPEQFLTWAVPAGVIKKWPDQANRVELKRLSGPAELYVRWIEYVTPETQTIPNKDFEETTDLSQWTKEGSAFQVRTNPVIYGGQAVGSVSGTKILTSWNGSEVGTGTLTSPEFFLFRNTLTFRIGGKTSSPSQLGVNLLVDGVAVCTATGTNASAGTAVDLTTKTWNIEEFKNKMARIQIVDTATNASIFVDAFEQQ